MIDRYIDYITSVRRYSPRTCAIYREVLEEFAEFSGISRDWKITPVQIRNYEVWLMDDKGKSPRTVNLSLSVLSGFCKFLMKEKVLESNPVRLVSRPKMEKRLPEFYKDEEMKQYFESTEYVTDEDNEDIVNYSTRLRRLIVSILQGTGIRRSELISLTIGSFDKARKVLRVHGKGDKIREIPLISSLCNEISLYLHSVESLGGGCRPASEPLLVTKTGKQLYPVFVDRAVKEELGKVTGITGRKAPHVLRHTLATGLLNEGADLNSIKELLGHSSLAATQVYTHNSIEKLKTVYNNAHPRAKRGGNYGDKD